MSAVQYTRRLGGYLGIYLGIYLFCLDFFSLSETSFHLPYALVEDKMHVVRTQGMLSYLTVSTAAARTAMDLTSPEHLAGQYKHEEAPRRLITTTCLFVPFSHPSILSNGTGVMFIIHFYILLIPPSSHPGRDSHFS